jgi:hypothetical protein
MELILRVCILEIRLSIAFARRNPRRDSHQCGTVLNKKRPEVAPRIDNGGIHIIYRIPDSLLLEQLFAPDYSEYSVSFLP